MKENPQELCVCLGGDRQPWVVRLHWQMLHVTAFKSSGRRPLSLTCTGTDTMRFARVYRFARAWQCMAQYRPIGHHGSVQCQPSVYLLSRRPFFSGIHRDWINVNFVSEWTPSLLATVTVHCRGVMMTTMIMMILMMAIGCCRWWQLTRTRQLIARISLGALYTSGKVSSRESYFYRWIP